MENARFEEIMDEEFLMFDRIQDDERLHRNPAICALLKLCEIYSPKKKSDLIVCAEHDIVCLCGDLGSISEKDAIYLARCGIHYSSEFDCFAMFC